MADARIESRSDGTPMIVGYAAVYYDGTRETEYLLWGGVKERIMPGAFDEVLKAGPDVRALFNHDPNNLLGRVSASSLRLSTDERGLRYEIDPPDTQAGRDVLTLVRRGDLQGSSFSFEWARDGDRWSKEDDFEIHEIIRFGGLFDVGPVTFPAYEGTTAGVRGADSYEETRKSLEKWRKDVDRARRYCEENNRILGLR